MPANAKSTAEKQVAPYLSPRGLQFLRGLARNNQREWFNERKAAFEADVKRPMLAILEAVTSAMTEFAPAHVRAPEQILMRIYRDTRFSKDKLPYKTHVAGWWVRDGLQKTSGAGYYLHISGKEVVIAFGAYMADPEQLLLIRRHLLDQHAQYRRLFCGAKVCKLFPDAEEGDPLRRSPKGFPSEHPALDLIRQRRWGRSTTLPADAAIAVDFAKQVAGHFRAAAPLVDLLNTPLRKRAERPHKPLF